MVAAPPTAEEDQRSAPSPASPGERRLFRFTLFLAILTAVLTVGTPLIGTTSLHSADLLKRYYPWREDAPDVVQPQNSILTDVVDAVTPMQADAQRQLRQGDFPLRSSYPSGGQALGTVANTGLLGPTEAPRLFLPMWYATGIVKLLQLLTALALTFGFLRLLGLGRSASVLGGVLFMNSGFMLISTNWPHAGVTTLIPGIFWGVERAIQRGTMRSALPLAAVTAGMFFQGYPSVTGYTLLAAGIYSLIRIFGSRDVAPPLADARGRAAAALRRPRVPRRWLRLPVFLAVGVALGVGLSALQLFPFAEELGTYNLEYRKQNPNRILPLRSLATLGIPHGLGPPIRRLFYAPRNYAEMQAFIGAAAIVLILVGLTRLRRDRLPKGVLLYFLGATATAFTLIYVGRLPLKIFQVLLPPLFGINFVGRMRSLLGFLLACVAAICFQAFVDVPAERRRTWWRTARTAVILAAGALLVGYAYRRLWEIADTAGRLRYLVEKSVVPVGAAVVTLLAIWLSTRLRDRRRALALMLVPAVVMIESVAFANGYLPRIPVEDFYPVTSTHRFLLDHLDHERVAAADAVIYPGTTTYYGIRSVSSHGFHHTAWVDLLVRAGARPPRRSPTLPLLRRDASVGTSPILDRLAARYWVTAPTGPYSGTAVPAPPAVGTTKLLPGQAVEVPVRRSGVRAVGVRLVTSRVGVDEKPSLRVEALDAAGRVVGAGHRRLFPSGRGEFLVPIVQSDRQVAAVRLRSTARQPVTVSTDAAGRPGLSYVLDNGDGLRTVFVDGTVVYERTRALPRIRWAPRSVVETNPVTRVAMLGGGVAPDTVVLNEEAPAASGAPGRVTITEDKGARVAARVDAKGGGYLVVADAMQLGWRATVDGRPARLVLADHAVVAVHVPAGVHEVALDYHPEGWRAGLTVSGLSLLAILVIGLRLPRHAARLLRRRRTIAT